MAEIVPRITRSSASPSTIIKKGSKKSIDLHISQTQEQKTDFACQSDELRTTPDVRLRSKSIKMEDSTVLKKGPKKRKVAVENINTSTGKRLKRNKSGEKESIFMITELPKQPPHMSCYMNNDIVAKMRSIMSEDGYARFKKTCFGVYMNMPKYYVQRQLFRCFMSCELKTSSCDALSIQVNGTSLTFTKREFAIITGLNCDANKEDFVYDTDQPNRLINEYFCSGDTVNKAVFTDAITRKNKMWGNNSEDELKLCILYFIHVFILSAERKSANIPRLHFDVVESDRYTEYPWGSESFDELSKTIHKKLKPKGKYYRIQGMPLAMQVWIYECCSAVDPKIAVKINNDQIPRLLNWETKMKNPRFTYLMKRMFNEKKKQAILYNNISPSAQELAALRIPPEDFKTSTRPISARHDSVDDFVKTPPSWTVSKGKAKVVISSTSSATKRRRNQSSKTPGSEDVVRRSSPRFVRALVKETVPTVPTFNQHDVKVQKKPTGDPSTRLRPNVVKTSAHSSSHTSDFSLLSQKVDDLEAYVKSEFKGLRRLISDKFNMVLDAINAKNTDEKVPVAEAPSHVPIHEIHKTPTDSRPKFSPLKNHEFSINSENPEVTIEVGEVQEQVDCKGTPVVNLSEQPMKLSTRNEILDINEKSSEQKYSDGASHQDANKLPVQESTNVTQTGGVNMEAAEDGFMFQVPVQINQDMNHDVEQNISFSQFELPNEFLPSLNSESFMVRPPVSNTDEQTGPRNRRPAPWNTSPYLTSFGSSASTSVNDLVPDFDQKQPFENDPITGPHNFVLYRQYMDWVGSGLLARHSSKTIHQNRYKKDKAVIHPPIYFGSGEVKDKNWFYKISFDGQMLNNSHIDVIGYYLRKKSKYQQHFSYKFTVVNTLFMSIISLIWENYTTPGGQNMDRYGTSITEYINGFRMYAAVPWYTVDYVFIPVHVKERNHWVLAVLSFDDRCIYVYDSMRAAGHDPIVKREIRKLSHLLPLYLESTDFYKKKGIDVSSHPRYCKDQVCDFIEEQYVDNIAVQPPGSMDCGIYVVAYMEFLSNGSGIPPDLNSQLLRERYGALLWNYGMRKIEANATSDNEAPQKIVRPRIEDDTIPRILVDS